MSFIFLCADELNNPNTLFVELFPVVSLFLIPCISFIYLHDLDIIVQFLLSTFCREDVLVLFSHKDNIEPCASWHS